MRPVSELTATEALAAEALAERAGQALERVRSEGRRVHCLTNAVVLELTANTLLAAGALPSMTSSVEEVADFVAGADALVVNLGTLDGDRRRAISGALDAAVRAAIPWVLDPVLVDRSPGRGSYALEIAVRRPAAVRCNASEAATLGAALAQDLARRLGTVAAVTGAVDSVSDGARTVRIDAGHPWMDRVTGVGCAGTALVAAFLAVEDDPLVATAGALGAIGIAGEIAGAKACGPGTFKAALLDALAGLDAAALAARCDAFEIAPARPEG